MNDLLLSVTTRLLPAGRRIRDLLAPTPVDTEQSARITALSPKDANKAAPMILTPAVYRAIADTIGSRPAESGGPLGGVRGSGLVSHYQPDPTAHTTGVLYEPDIEHVNGLFRNTWNPAGINLLGFVHSHPAGNRRPSTGDLRYATRILAGIPELDRLLLPIVQTEPDTGRFAVHAYAARRDGSRVVIDDLDLVVRNKEPEPIEPGPELDRVREAYDPTVMQGARIVSVGCGGGASFLEDMARAGTAEFVLIDPDVVEAPNVGTQQAYLTDIGRPKVDVIAERLCRISSTVKVWTIRATLGELTDNGLRQLVRGVLDEQAGQVPSATLLCAFTDNFHAQAQVARVGLNLGVAVIGGTVYQNGLGVELTFAVPGVTPACIRCALSSRYRAYLDQGYQNTVTSNGTPISATARLNGLKLPIALGILHTVSTRVDPDHPATIRHRAHLRAVADRNLVLASMVPSDDTTLGLTVFGDTAGLDPKGRFAADSTVYLRQEPDGPATGRDECPDCGGSGDIRSCIGTFVDTAPMPLVFGDHRRTLRRDTVASTS